MPNKQFGCMLLMMCVTLALVIAGCSNDDNTVNPPPPPAGLASNPASISVQMGQQASSTISGGTQPYNIHTNPDSSIATVALNGATLTVTGVSVGSTAVVIGDNGGSTPITVAITVTTGGGGGGGGSTEFLVTPFDMPWGFIPTGGAPNVRGFVAGINFKGQSIMGGAMFLNAAGTRVVSGGTVTVNSNTLGEHTSGDTTYYLSENLTGVGFDGSSHAWTVSGNGEVPAFTASVTSPSGGLTITHPSSFTDQIPVSSDLTVTWTSSGQDSIFLVIGDSQGHRLAAVTTGNSYTFTPVELAPFVSGYGWIEMYHFTRSVVAEGGYNYVVLAAAFDEVNFVWVP
jgi:hypothetical protein